MAIGNHPRVMNEIMLGADNGDPGFAGGGSEFWQDGTILTAGTVTRKGDSGGAGGAATPMVFAIEDTESGGPWDISNLWGSYDFVSADGGGGVAARLGVRMAGTGGNDTALEMWVKDASVLLLGATLDNNLTLNLPGALAVGPLGLPTNIVTHIEVVDIANAGLKVHLADGQSGATWPAIVISSNDNFASESGIAFTTDSIGSATGQNSPGMFLVRTSGTEADLKLYAQDADSPILLMTLDGSANLANFPLDISVDGTINANGNAISSTGAITYTVASGVHSFAGGDVSIEAAVEPTLQLKNTDGTIEADQILGAIDVGAVDDDVTQLQSARILFKASEDWAADPFSGTYMEVWTTETGTNATALAATFGNDKSLAVLGPLSGTTGTFTGDVIISTSVQPTLKLQNTDTTIILDQIIGGINWGALDDDQTNLESSKLRIRASEVWGVGATGSYLEVHTTASGSVTPAVAATFGEDKSLTLVGDLIVNGLNIGITPDPDLITMSLNRLTINGALDVVGISELGDGGITNYTAFAADGLQTMVGSARVTREISYNAQLLGPGPGNDPDVGTIGVAAVLLFDDALEEEVFISREMPHDWEPGTDIHVHFHWAPVDNGAGNVTWAIEYKFIEGNNGELLTGGTATAIVNDATTTTQDEVLESGEILLSGAGIGAGEVLIMRLFRDSDASEGGATDSYGSDAALVVMHLEYQVNKLGEDMQF